jgi:hypothetical protein
MPAAAPTRRARPTWSRSTGPPKSPPRSCRRLRRGAGRSGIRRRDDRAVGDMQLAGPLGATSACAVLRVSDFSSTSLEFSISAYRALTRDGDLPRCDALADVLIGVFDAGGHVLVGAEAGVLNLGVGAAVEGRLLPGELLPALDGDVDVRRRDL